MKMLLVVLTGLISFNTFAEDMTAEKAILTSEQFKNEADFYVNAGGSLKCDNFLVTSSTELPSMLKEYTKVALAVTSECLVDPNDGLDPFKESLLSFVTVTTNHQEKTSNWEVVSLNLVYIPQPD